MNFKEYFVLTGPTAFLHHKIVFGKKLTSYPSFKDKLSNNFINSDDCVVQDENLIKSQGSIQHLNLHFK